MAWHDDIHAKIRGPDRPQDWFADGCMFVVTSGLWFGWIMWAILSTKSPGMIVGLVLVGLFLVYCTYAGRKTLFLGFIAAIIFTIIMALILPGGLLFLLMRLILLIASPICVTGGRPWSSSASAANLCRLCEKCDLVVKKSSLLRGSPWLPVFPREQYQFYGRTELMKSMDNCHLCRLLFRSVARFVEVDPSDKELLVEEEMRLKIWMKRYWMDAPDLQVQLSGHSVKESIPLKLDWLRAEDVSHGCNDSLYTDSEDTAKWANQCIAKCREHPRCQAEFVPSSQRAYLPLRLLDLEGIANGFVRLVSTDRLHKDESVSYCALSHCWGGTVRAILTRDNYDAMSTIEVRILPKNFRDAIEITTQLGQRYLWVDSLCIVQDDKDEWHAESAKMGLVYSNAKCVIAATDSADSTGGCFQKRILDFNDCLLYTAGSKVLAVKTCKRSPEVQTLIQQLVDPAPLAHRAWAFQERYLARRTLHYCRGMVLFECNAMVASAHDQKEQQYSFKTDVQANGRLHEPTDVMMMQSKQKQWTPSPPNYSKLTLAKHRQAARRGWERRRKLRPEYIKQQEMHSSMLLASARLGTRGAFDFLWRFKGESIVERIEFHNRWFELVQQYSQRHLTYQADKAMAIAGIASSIEQTTGLTYNMGLWLQMLPCDLLWTIEGSPKPRPSRPIPSWSWASVDSKISNPLWSETEGVKNDHTSQYTWGRRNIFRNDWLDVRSYIDSPNIVAMDKPSPQIVVPTLELRGKLCAMDPDCMTTTYDTTIAHTDEALYYLPVISFVNACLPPKTKAAQLHGMVLRKLHEDGICYERLGHFWTSDEHLFEQASAATHTDQLLRIQ